MFLLIQIDANGTAGDLNAKQEFKYVLNLWMEETELLVINKSST